MKKVLSISLLSISALLLFGCQAQDAEQDQPVIEEEQPITIEPMKLQPEPGDKIAVLSTTHGDITILLYEEKAPETVKNFEEHSNEGRYDNVPFHRIIDNFMIQGGDFENKNGTGGHSYKGPGTSLQDEFGEGLEHVYGAVSMANAGPNTGGSQFFIVQNKNGTPHLNGMHAIFGYVYDGMDTVEKMADVETGAMDKPEEDVAIKSVEIIEFK